MSTIKSLTRYSQIQLLRPTRSEFAVHLANVETAAQNSRRLDSLRLVSHIGGRVVFFADVGELPRGLALAGRSLAARAGRCPVVSVAGLAGGVERDAGVINLLDANSGGRIRRGLAAIAFAALRGRAALLHLASTFGCLQNAGTRSIARVRRGLALVVLAARHVRVAPCPIASAVTILTGAVADLRRF